MAITREQVADLREGDVVELSWPDMSILRGTLRGTPGGGLGFEDAGWTVRYVNGEPPFSSEKMNLIVIERAPRPLYVNHPRTEPVAGDIARNAAGEVRGCQPTRDHDSLVWWRFDYFGNRRWTYAGKEWLDSGPITLMVDGETGHSVPEFEQ